MSAGRRSDDEGSRTEIVVRGRFGPALTSALGVHFEEVTVDHGHTRLVADVPDQPALLGLLDVLAALNLQIVSLNPRTDAGGPRPQAASPAESDDWAPLY